MVWGNNPSCIKDTDFINRWGQKVRVILILLKNVSTFKWVYICTYQYELSKNVPHGSRIPSFLFGVKRIKVKVIDYTWIWFRGYFYIICYSYSCSFNKCKNPSWNVLGFVSNSDQIWIIFAIVLRNWHFAKRWFFG